MLFNDVDQLTFTEVVERLNAPEDEAMRTLHSLACGK